MSMVGTRDDHARRHEPVGGVRAHAIAAVATVRGGRSIVMEENVIRLRSLIGDGAENSGRCRREIYSVHQLRPYPSPHRSLRPTRGIYVCLRNSEGGAGAGLSSPQTSGARRSGTTGYPASPNDEETMLVVIYDVLADCRTSAGSSALHAILLVAMLALVELFVRAATHPKMPQLRGSGRLWLSSSSSPSHVGRRGGMSFLPSCCPSSEQPELAEAEALLAALPQMLHDQKADASSLEQIRRSCERLPIIDLRRHLYAENDDDESGSSGDSSVRSAREEAMEALAERAALVYSFLAYAYLRAPNAPPLFELPATLAVPWAAASAFLGRAMGLDYVATVLNNCTVLDGHAVTVGATFTGAADEAHFYAVHARIEATAEPAVRAMLDAVNAQREAAARSGSFGGGVGSGGECVWSTADAARLTFDLAQVARGA